MQIYSVVAYTAIPKGNANINKHLVVGTLLKIFSIFLKKHTHSEANEKQTLD